MKILLVLELYDGASNGNTISAHHLADNLRARGHEVRIAASGETYDGKWGFGVYHVPVFDKLISAHGFMFGIPDEKKMEEAVHWADIVHVMMPFPLGKLATRIAVRDGIPCTGAFHIQPENIWSSVGLGNFMPLINFTYWFANRYVFRYFHYIHCPSRMISNMLKSHGYKAEMRIISNGISLTEFKYHKCPKRKEFQDRFVVVMSGRLSREKRQDILINAVKKSKYADKIQLFIGQRADLPYRFRHDPLGIVCFLQHIADLSVPSVNIGFSLHGNISNDLSICQDCPENPIFSLLLFRHADPPLGIIFCIGIGQTVRKKLPVCIVA